MEKDNEKHHELCGCYRCVKDDPNASPLVVTRYTKKHHELWNQLKKEAKNGTLPKSTS